MMPETAPPAAATARDDRTLLEIEDLRVHFPSRGGVFRKGSGGVVKAVDGVDLRIRTGETLGLVGESGCGKTTLGLSVMRARDEMTGRLLYHASDGVVDVAGLSAKELKRYRREVRMIFQDPHSSLNPRLTLLDIVGEPLRVNLGLKGRELERRVARILRRVGLRPEYMHRYPHAFSGGERQRVSIARALVLDPRLVVADEAVSALDVSVRSQILQLLQELQEEFDLTYLFISHDLSVVEYLCDRVAVMYLGKVVELSTTTELYAKPQHPYTEALLSAVPKPDPRQRGSRERIVLQGDVADPSNVPSGCSFRTRCPYATDRCAAEEPPLREITPGRFTACHYSEELDLRGVV